jgi:chromosome segregation and condensation protein ScpB
MSKKRRSRYIAPKSRLEKRQDEIKRVLAIALFEKQTALSMRQIAKAMKISHGSYLMGVLFEMAEQGDLAIKEFAYRGGIATKRYTFTLPPQHVAKAAAKAWAS